MATKPAEPIDPGCTDKLFEVWRRTSRPGSQGQPKNTWFKVAEVWVQVETLGGVELERVQRRFATCNHRLHLNWSETAASIHPKDRLKWGGMTFEISAVKDVNFEKVKIEILVSQIVTRKNATNI